MGQPRLIIVCGIPGAGKSTFALHMAARCGAIGFASETFAAELGADTRTRSGDLTQQAIGHAYAAMGAAVSAALQTNALVLAVGSFRGEGQRRQFRDIARRAGADVTTIRIACPVSIAASRVRARIAQGEHGPTERAIQHIDTELDRANDIDIVISNDATIERFRRRADEIKESLSSRRLDSRASGRDQ